MRIEILATLVISACLGYAQSPQKPIMVKASELRDSYAKSKAGADEKYKGRIVVVTGIIPESRAIKSGGRDETGALWVRLRTDGIWGVICTFKRDKATEGKVLKTVTKEGIRVKITGRCDGDDSNTGDYICINDCTEVELDE